MSPKTAIAMSYLYIIFFELASDSQMKFGKVRKLWVTEMEIILCVRKCFVCGIVVYE